MLGDIATSALSRRARGWPGRLWGTPRVSPGTRRGLAWLGGSRLSLVRASRPPGAWTVPSGKGETRGIPTEPTGREPSRRSAWHLRRRGGPGARGPSAHSQPSRSVASSVSARVGSAGAKAGFWGGVRVQLQVPHLFEPVQAEKGLIPGMAASRIRDTTRAALDEAPETTSTPQTGRRSRSDGCLQTTWSPPRAVPAKQVPAPAPKATGGTLGALKWKRNG